MFGVIVKSGDMALFWFSWYIHSKPLNLKRERLVVSALIQIPSQLGALESELLGQHEGKVLL